MTAKLNLIVAGCRKNYGIGIGNTLPWILSEDRKYFKEITTGNNFSK